MNISELAKDVASITETSEADAKVAVLAVFEAIRNAAAKGEEVAIPGFGKFSVKDRPERQGRNPATGEAITIAAAKKVSFTPAKGLKDKL
ncbi:MULTISPECIES: HU family DNA-binding protein [Sphingomonas]|jgi:DNA-binding protein HU-beta|uniref:HU family DNA-binding protein n=1 Tax=Sphingomonas TaxID=13687 RepID=UPI000DBC045E|nr:MULTISPECIES: HU family DNA-binding protein [Sphingomonas]MDG5973516.1 HU family DNA-binding protein [Sphingomonas paucimobilis]PZT90482.1 MAG: DNA-binding protein HU [Sphingomonas sp.]